MDTRERPFQQIHLIEAWNAPDILFERSDIYHATSLQLIEALKLTTIGESKVFPYPVMGFSFQTFLTESEFSGHTWQETGNYLNYLLHTCSVTDFSRAREIAQEVLQTDEVIFTEITPHRRRMAQRPSGIYAPN